MLAFVSWQDLEGYMRAVQVESGTFCEKNGAPQFFLNVVKIMFYDDIQGILLDIHEW